MHPTTIGTAICVRASAYLNCASTDTISTRLLASVSAHHKNAQRGTIGTANSANVGAHKMWTVRLDITGMKTSANVYAFQNIVQPVSTGTKLFVSASASLNSAHQTISGAKSSAGASVYQSAVLLDFILIR